ncbi:hypothetical protein [Thalassotalea montiporae]
MFKVVSKKQVFSQLSLALVIASSCAVANASSDPTRPLVAGLASANVDSATRKPGELVLQSIISPSAGTSPQGESAVQHKAIISGQLVSLGEQVDGYQVIDISERQVVLQSEDKSKELVLFSRSVVTYK